MTEVPKREELEKYAQQLAVLEQVAVQQVAKGLIEAAAEAGYEIVAIPQITQDGRIGAVWTLRRKE